MESTPKITKKHLAYCFSTVINSLKKKTRKPLPYPSDLKDFSLPLFITWKVTKTDDLRGCIGKIIICLIKGTFAKDLLSENMGKYAHTSAFDDSRFNPISLKEIPNLSVCDIYNTNY